MRQTGPSTSPSAATSAQPRPLWDGELAALTHAAPAWLWHGFLAPGNITMLTSLWKSGKTTLLAQLLARRKQPSQLLGLAVRPGKSIVLSEESSALWAERSRQHDFGNQVCFFTEPFRHVPTAEEWQELLAQVAALHAEHGADLLVVDPLAHFLRMETTAQSILQLLFPLRALTARGMAVLLLHQPKKGAVVAGQAGRGHGALHSHVDISIEMQHAGKDLETRARRFQALSRHTETPRQLLFTWNAAGSDYEVLPDAAESHFRQHWDVLRMVLEEAAHKLTRQEILDAWPSDHDKPARSTLWLWLDRAVKAGLIAGAGRGSRREPFRYWLPQAAARLAEQSTLQAIIAEEERLRRELGLLK